MRPYVYWSAPLWEVLVMVLISLALLVWLLVWVLRRGSLSRALSSISPILDDRPLFFFDRVKGLRSLNEAAKRVLKAASKRQLLLDALTETLLEACEEGRITRHRHWPKPGYILVAIPLSGQPGKVAGVLALVIAEESLPSKGHPVGEPPAAEAKAWITLGSELRLHRTKPLVQVRRIGENARITPGWHEYRLSHREEKLLRHLLAHRGEVQTAETLFKVAWPDDPVSEWGLRPEQKERLRRLIFQLRQRIEPDPGNPRYLCTVHGVGYVFYSERELCSGETAYDADSGASTA